MKIDEYEKTSFWDENPTWFGFILQMKRHDSGFSSGLIFQNGILIQYLQYLQDALNGIVRIIAE